MKEGDIVNLVSDICPVAGNYLQRGTYIISSIKLRKNRSGKYERDVQYIKMAFLHHVKDDSPYGWVSYKILVPVKVEDLI